MAFEPQLQHGRRMLAKICQLVTTMDDIYDIYGTLDELKLLTDAIARFVARSLLMADYSKAYLTEAKWYHSGYTPTLREYLDNATVSVSGEVILGWGYFCVENPITKEAFHYLEQRPNVLQWTFLIMRLADDLATWKSEIKRGDVPKSIQGYMYETGASEEEARQQIRYLLNEAWKKMNRDLFSNPLFSQTFIRVVLGMAQLTSCIYPDGEEYDDVLLKSTDMAKSLFFEPIP
ncbi:unnamed protein product [Dovyalis caffra]|uniref:Terpene synthase metal-binding domain-containing protein n=1 Tax=Dovyalis caffra TaxID=77055 RepID=A0AAV1RQK0_9ROSI|nr:unnamed protein product [Dovyalis caffra]